MKKLIILAIVALLGSCKKNNTTSPEPVKDQYIAFAGVLGGTGHAYINGIEKQLVVAYLVKKGDICNYIDYGTDVAAWQEPILTPIGGGASLGGTIHPKEEGFTAGSIMKDGVEVRTYQGYGDTNLSYTIQ